jgi:hypothetical protein
MSDISGSFLEEMLKMQHVPQAWDNSDVRMATVDSSYSGVGLPQVRFDGESQPSVTGYNSLAGYTPQPGDRVIMLRISTAWVIMGTAEGSLRSYRALGDSDELPVIARDGDLVRLGQHNWWEYDGDLGLWGPHQTWHSAWGQVVTLSDAGGETSASTSQVTLFQTADFQVFNGRCYALTVNHNWRGSNADNVIDYDLIINHNGVDTVVRTFREGNPVGTGTNAAETVTDTVHWHCGADDATCYMWTRAGRLTGTGTITMGSATAFVADIGPT